ncbi:MAG: TIGR00282 family metallophosphoesterase [Planctomycetota bacterium]
MIEPAILAPVDDEALRVAFIGDVVGKPGMRIVCSTVPWLRREQGVQCVIANAENAADGSGLRCKDYRRLVEHGVDGITLGDHVFRKKEIIEALESESNLIRPANLPSEAPGASHMILEVDEETKVAVFSALGRVFMKPIDCPFHAMDRELEEIAGVTPIQIVDFHAEATSDMQIMGRYLNGRVSAVLGTHTHVATADDCIFPGGTAFQSDVGMTGPFESILGRRIDAVLEATLKSLPTPFQVATADIRLNATVLDIDRSTGKCQRIERLEVREEYILAYHEQLEAAKKVL